MENTNGENMIILDSARKHGISDRDIREIAANPYVALKLRDEPKKYLLLGFDSNARALEIITDTGEYGQVYVIHADKITKTNEKLLEEVL